MMIPDLQKFNENEYKQIDKKIAAVHDYDDFRRRM